jgi:ABC-type Co2+ transport system permease subunit
MTKKALFESVDKKVRRSRKSRDIALLLPIIGIILFLTPIHKIFSTSTVTPSLSGLLLFIFGVWAVLIFAALILSRTLIPELRDK